MHQINASIALNAYWFLGNFILPALAIASPAPNWSPGVPQAAQQQQTRFQGRGPWLTEPRGQICSGFSSWDPQFTGFLVVFSSFIDFFGKLRSNSGWQLMPNAGPGLEVSSRVEFSARTGGQRTAVPGGPSGGSAPGPRWKTAMAKFARQFAVEKRQKGMWRAPAHGERCEGKGG